MMWNWMISSLALGVTLILYDGSPFKPSSMKLWDIIDHFKVTHFGTSAKYIQTLQDFKEIPSKNSKKNLEN